MGREGDPEPGRAVELAADADLAASTLHHWGVEG